MTEMSDNIAQLKTELSSMIETANDLDTLEQARVTHARDGAGGARHLGLLADGRKTEV